MADITVQIASLEHKKYAEEICKEMEESAKVRGTGIAKRDPEYIRKKMEEGKAIIAVTNDGRFAGFCYIETWDHGKFVSNSGLIVVPEFRKFGLATKIKKKAFELTRQKYPNAKLFGLTTSAAVMKINSDLGYRPVTFAELTDDDDFWKGCQGCVNYEVLMSKNRKMCFCTGMLYDPHEKKQEKWDFIKKSAIWERWQNFKTKWLFKIFEKEKEKEQNTITIK
ncbi:MAG: GNAT family N-acetyltransferase [Cytophagaceae bacterium]|nr:GNAT family N-acetyltransferase [Cytophagaceae bacterium]MDW8455919.1 GNAT family N-acetyltransferase [Cytophagaceae bacterium]